MRSRVFWYTHRVYSETHLTAEWKFFLDISGISHNVITWTFAYNVRRVVLNVFYQSLATATAFISLSVFGRRRSDDPPVHLPFFDTKRKTY